MALTAALCSSYKQEILSGTHTSANTYKIALYTSAATLDATTTAYTATGEVTGTGYAAGGIALSGFTTGLSSTTAYLTFTNPAWASSTLAGVVGALIYNSSVSNKAVCVLTWASASDTNGTFTVQLPAAGATSTVTIG